jgi:hypothetical protein
MSNISSIYDVIKKCNRDLIDDVVVNDGDILRVKWPNGSITFERMLNEMHGRSSFRHLHSYFVLNIEGFKIKIFVTDATDLVFNRHTCAAATDTIVS